ncbi:hypothetical protein GCM10010452_22230 [Crossiella cryophila]|uniref:Pimeloyl-ACP methyl ester carboxylesterase n=1 Tax=Crossiella cryophila TaxID=43355 RepID=A0A7W7CHZ2_9PSEU|nr:alpha/beta fold hydrolase [Crossiella cryophila]MBB4681465.1 pimeloyl-ACP methyl ester carboxylesterase [Crossiella cryophila]
MTVDLRGHGRSAAAPWPWPGALADLSAVVDGLRSAAPAVIGHSLGGIVAALWAAGHPDCPLAVNLDGHTNPARPEHYAAPDPDSAHRALRGFLDAELAAAAAATPLLELIRIESGHDVHRERPAVVAALVNRLTG